MAAVAATRSETAEKSESFRGTCLAPDARVRVRLTRKLADCLDGVDLTGRHVGDMMNLPSREARLLIAEHWATPAERRREQSSPPGRERRACAEDREPNR